VYRYAGLLASQGRLEEAATYLKGVSIEENILIDRLFNASINKPAGSRPPTFPFEKVLVERVKPKVAAVIASTVQPTSTVNGTSSRGNQVCVLLCFII
jgi:hypothetical protein